VPHSEHYDEFDHLVYLRVIETCNMRCDHCFIPANPKRMNISDIVNVPSMVSEFADKGDRVLLQWHGGEPTLAGVTWMDHAISLIEENRNFRWKHDIQTNLMEYDADWMALFKEHFNGVIGVSWDYDIRRFKGSLEKYEDKFWSNVERAISDGLTLKLTVTGTRPFFNRYASRFHEFIDMVSLAGIKFVHIERLTKTGYARENWEKLGVSNLEYSKFMSKIASSYHLYLNSMHGQDTLSVSPFDGLERSLLSLSYGHPDGGSGCLSGKCDTSFHTIDASGYKRGCTAITSEIDNTTSEKYSSNVISFFPNIDTTRQSRVKSCSECEFQPICSSGCFCSERLDSSGECSGGKILFSHLNAILKSIEKRDIISHHRCTRGASSCL